MEASATGVVRPQTPALTPVQTAKPAPESAPAPSSAQSQPNPPAQAPGVVFQPSAPAAPVTYSPAATSLTTGAVAAPSSDIVSGEALRD